MSPACNAFDSACKNGIHLPHVSSNQEPRGHTAHNLQFRRLHPLLAHGNALGSPFSHCPLTQTRSRRRFLRVSLLRRFQTSKQPSKRQALQNPNLRIMCNTDERGCVTTPVTTASCQVVAATVPAAYLRDAIANNAASPARQTKWIQFRFRHAQHPGVRACSLVHVSTGPLCSLWFIRLAQGTPRG
jgi:hypothetical protein